MKKAVRKDHILCESIGRKYLEKQILRCGTQISGGGDWALQGRKLMGSGLSFWGVVKVLNHGDRCAALNPVEAVDLCAENG